MKKTYISPSNSVYTISIQSNILIGSPGSELGGTVYGRQPTEDDSDNNFSREASTDIWDQEW